MVSAVYPVRAYACAAGCGWRGTLVSTSAFARRKRLARRVLVIVLLTAGGGWAVWSYRADLIWSPAPSPDSEEASGP